MLLLWQTRTCPSALPVLSPSTAADAGKPSAFPTSTYGYPVECRTACCEPSCQCRPTTSQCPKRIDRHSATALEIKYKNDLAPLSPKIVDEVCAYPGTGCDDVSMRKDRRSAGSDDNVRAARKRNRIGGAEDVSASDQMHDRVEDVTIRDKDVYASDDVNGLGNECGIGASSIDRLSDGKKSELGHVDVCQSENLNVRR